MTKRVFISLLAFPLLSFSMTESEFYLLVTNASTQIRYAQTKVDNIYYRLEESRSQANALIQTYANSAAMTGFDYDQGRLDGATAIYNKFERDYASDFSSISTSLQVAQESLNQMRWGDYEGYLKAISNYTYQTWQEAIVIDTHITNQFITIERIATSLSNLEVFFIGQDGSVPTVDFQALARELLDWCYKAKHYYDMFLEIEEQFTKYFELVNSRVEHPDSSLSTDLNQMWLNCLSRVADVIQHPERYHIQDQTSFLLSDSSLRLSNEGVLLAENLAVNQREYLCSVEALKKLDSLTNLVEGLLVLTNSPANSVDVDLSNITNYLWDIQRPYYDLFNSALSYNIRQPDSNPYRSYTIDPFTNLVELVNSHGRMQDIRTTYASFRNNSTNFWGRLELYLLNMQGLIPSPNSNVSYDPSDTALRDQVDQSTNFIFSSVSEVQSVGERFEEVKEKFGELLSAFNLEGAGSGFSVLVLCPSFTVMGIYDLPEIAISYSDIQSVVEACRIVFTCLWYLIFGFIGFRLVFLTVSLFVKTVTHTILIVSTLLSGS